ncbi:MAG: hypothetical protein ACHP84_13875 [Caulobacterales bacterium]
MLATPASILCRQIEERDLEAVGDLLTREFPARTRAYWSEGLARLKAHTSPEGYPRFGYLLEVDGVVIGAVLLIFRTDGAGPRARIRCNVSSLCIDRAFRGHAVTLVRAALKLERVTFVKLSAAARTWSILEGRGFRRYSQGQFVALPALSAGPGKIRPFGEADRDLPDFDLIKAHADVGCIALVCDTSEGHLPFVFIRRRLAYAPFGVMQLIYCRDPGSFVQHAGALGRFLLRRGVVCVICDAEAAIRGLAGWFVKDKVPRYYRGPDRPGLNDLAFTELVLFGP